jgi:hypothetical protein
MPFRKALISNEDARAHNDDKKSLTLNSMMKVAKQLTLVPRHDTESTFTSDTFDSDTEGTKFLLASLIFSLSNSNSDSFQMLSLQFLGTYRLHKG